MGIRPEDMKIDASQEILRNRLEGTMAHSTFVGDQMIFEIRINDTLLTAKAMPDGKRPEGKVSLFSQGKDGRVSRCFVGIGLKPIIESELALNVQKDSSLPLGMTP